MKKKKETPAPLCGSLMYGNVIAFEGGGTPTSFGRCRVVAYTGVGLFVFWDA